MPNETSCTEMEVSDGKIKQEHAPNGNEQRKTNAPTLMITVKNEMAQPIREQTIPTTGKIRIFLRDQLKKLIVYFLNS